MLRGLSSDGREACARDLALQDHGATTASLSQSGCQFIEHSENQSVSWQGTAGVGDDFVVSQRDSHNLLRPETVESLHVLYSLTGDTMYQVRCDCQAAGDRSSPLPACGLPANSSSFYGNNLCVPLKLDGSGSI